MTVRTALFTTIFLGAAIAATPAAASVSVLGGSAARQCFQAAESPMMPTTETLDVCDLAITSEPLTDRDMVATYINRGILRVRVGRTGDGISDFNRAIERDPTVAEAWFNRGVALMRTGDAEQAMPSFQAAVERSTNRPALAYFGRAVANEALGNMPAAYADYRRASELDPDWDRPKSELRRFQVRLPRAVN